MVGTTYRRAGRRGLAYYTLEADQIKDLHAALGCPESVYVATCNRVETYVAVPAGTDVATVRARFFTFFAALRRRDASFAEPPLYDPRALMAYADDGAAERLFVVACALDSMVPGEAQILGQIKAAHHAAHTAGLSGPQLGALFAQAFGVAKKVRESTALGRGKTSMASLALELVAERLAGCGPTPTLVIVGTGPMSEQAARSFADRGVALHVVNRTLAKAQALALRCKGTAHALADFLRRPLPAQALVTSTASPVPLLDADVLRRMGTRPLVVDLSVRRDVAPLGPSEADCADVWDIDRLKERAQVHQEARKGQLAAGRALVDEALEAYHRLEAERSLSGALREWRGHNAALVQRELPALLKKLNGHDDLPARAAALEAWSARLLASLMHGPTHGLKQLARHFGHEAVHAFVEGARLVPPAGARAAAPTPPSKESR